MRHSLILLVLVLVTAVVGAVYLVGLRNEPGAQRHPSPRQQPGGSPTSPGGAHTPIASPPAVAPGSIALTYLQGTRIVTRARGQRGGRTIVDLQTADISASPASDWIAYVAAQIGVAPGDGDFVRTPKLHFRNLASGSDLNVGVGFSPLWDGAGTRIAYMAPDSPRSCDGETCAGAVRVMVAAPGQLARPITPFGRLHLLAWAGDRLLVADDKDLTRTTSLALDGSAAFSIPVPPSEIWDASPDGRLLLSVTPGRLHFTTLVRGHTTSSVRTVALASGILGDGSWSAGSGRVAGVLRGADGSAQMALLTADHGLLPIGGTEGAMGNVVWDRAGSRFAYVGVNEGHRGRLQAMLCNLGPGDETACKPWFSWVQGVSLLRLTSP
ncbi:MAG: hypothetical protein M3P01_14255 [Actinomycetota bacterium]|nr:hypothetical protein [Actinomycetota bacterium]